MTTTTITTTKTCQETMQILPTSSATTAFRGNDKATQDMAKQSLDERSTLLEASYAGGVLHVFPNPNKSPEQFNAWVRVVSGQDECDLDYKKLRICDRHFTERDWISSSITFLAWCISKSVS